MRRCAACRRCKTCNATEVHMERKTIDCRKYPSETNCSLTISGTEQEVLKAAREHAISSHGHRDGPELEEGLRKSLEDERITAAR